MASDDDIVVKLDLDNSSFNSSISQAGETLKAFGSGDNVKGLVDELSNMKGTIGEIAEGGSLQAITAGFAEFGPLLGAAAVALGGIAAAFSMTLEGEQIEAVSREFDLLAKNAGIAGDSMKEAFLKATDGMMTDTEALELANKAMLKLGVTSQQLPELMELARKSAMVMGTDVQTAFNNLTMAVASGNQRMLRRVGLMVDVKKAEQDYAESIGVTVGVLSQAGKSQAIMNSMLEASKTQFAGIDSSMKPVTTSWAQLKTAVSEFGEAFSVVIEHTLGPAFQGWLSLLTKVSKSTRDFFVENFGTGAEAAKLKAQALDDKLRGLASTIVKMQGQLDDEKSGKTGFWGKFFSFEHGDNLQNTITAMKANYEKLRAERDKLVSADQKKEGGSGAAGKPAIAATNNKLVEAENAKFYKELQAMRTQDAAYQAKTVQTDEQLARSDAATKVAMAQKLASDRKEIESKYHGDKKKIEALEVQLSKNYDNQIAEFDEQATARKIKALDNFGAHAKGTFDGFARAAEIASKKAQIDLQDTAKIGESAFSDLSSGAGDAFQEMGKGAAGGSMNIEHAVLGMLGKVAGKYGETMMLASLWPFNPAVFAAGAALEVLAGALGEVGSTSSSSAVSAPSAASSSTSDVASSKATAASQTPDVSSAQSAHGQAVTVNVQGSVLDSPATGMRIVDLIRQASDQTNYSYVQIGNKPYGS